jgi:F-type H+-transporting ATPase subunit delta
VIGAGEIARRYARAIFGLADGAKEHARLLDEIESLDSEIRGNADLTHVLLTPIHPRGERKAVIHDLADRLGLSVEVRASAEILVDENRLQILSALVAALRELVDAEAGRMGARVVSAHPLDAAAQQQIRAALSRRVNQEVAVEFAVDPELIGGVVARIGDLLLDGSIRTQLEQLGEILKRGSAT